MAGVQVSVPASGSTVVGYDCDITSLAEADYTGHTNTATVTLGDGSTISSAPVDVNFMVDSEPNTTVSVYDDKTDPPNPVYLGDVTIADAPMTFEYSVTFDATPGECVDYTNTAWVEVLGDDDPTAEFEIYVCDRSDLTLIKTVDASYDRDYDWDVEKTADQTRFDVAGDGTVTADYEVVATASDPIDTKARH